MEPSMSGSDTDVMDETVKFRTMKQFPNWPEIKEVLMEMAEGTMNTSQIIKALSAFKDFSYVNRFKKERNKKGEQFEALIERYDDEIPIIFCKISEFVLRENNFSYPLFQQSHSLQHNFTKQSILFLLCSMVLCLIPAQEYHNPQKKKDFCFQLDFSIVFQNSLYKTMAIIQYLKCELGKKQSYNQVLTIKRKSLNQNIVQILKEHQQLPMVEFDMKGDNQSIQEFYGQMKVDFANRYIGGGSLSHGCVQEEIMFANHPQMHVSQLLCQAMKSGEALLFIGFKKYSKNVGYGPKTTYAGKQTNVYTYDEKGRANEYILAIDALFEIKDSVSQYKEANIKREITKAYCGFSFDEGDKKKIVTGNWGCGAFGGNVQVKLLIQWIACTLAKKEMAYCPFGQLQKVYDQEIFEKLKKMKVGAVFELLLRACKRIRNQILLPSQDDPKPKKPKDIQPIDFFAKLKALLQDFYE